MSKHNWGGCAFPFVITHSDGTIEYDAGMTIRDYFAAKAMQGLLSGFYSDTTRQNLNEVVKEAYEIADSMLTEREKQL